MFFIYYDYFHLSSFVIIIFIFQITKPPYKIQPSAIYLQNEWIIHQHLIIKNYISTRNINHLSYPTIANWIQNKN